MSGHVLDRLSELLDGQLDADRRAEVESHLGACEACRRELARLREAAASLRALPQRPLPPGFLQRLEMCRRSAAAAPRSFFPGPLPVAAFAALSLIVSVVVYDKARLMSPITGGTPAFSVAKKDARLPSPALSSADLPQGRRDPTNEELQADLDRQKSRMGIRRILAKSEAASGAAGQMQAFEAPTLETAQPPKLDGNPTPTPLSQAAAAEGLLLKSEEERAKAWGELSLRAAPPRVNYKLNMVALVVAPDLATAVEVLGVETRAGGMVVRYRIFPRMAEVASVARQGAGLVKAYQFRVIPRTDKPVSFERAE